MMSDISREAMEDLVRTYKSLFVPGNKDNPTGKSYLDFTSSDLQKLSVKELTLMRRFFNDEQYNYTDQLLPKHMSRADFTRAILRELAHKGAIKDEYLRMFPSVPNFATQRISVMRAPLDGSESPLPRQVTELAAVIAIRDASIDIARNNTPGVRIAPDVASLIGKKGESVHIMDKDVDAFDFGYTVGAMEEFRRGDALQMRLKVEPKEAEKKEILSVIEALRGQADKDRKNGSITGETYAIRMQNIQNIADNMSNGAIQKNFCPTVDKIFQEGNLTEHRDAMILGFAQARIDGRTQFLPTTDRIGLFGNCTKPAQAR